MAKGLGSGGFRLFKAFRGLLGFRDAPDFPFVANSLGLGGPLEIETLSIRSREP